MRNFSPCTSANNASPSYTPYSVPSQVEGITLSVVFLLEAVLIVAGNFLTIGLFATERKIRKKSLFLVVNMAFADLISGAVCLPLYAYLSIGPSYRLWKTSYRALDFIIGWDVTDTTLSQASLQASFACCFYLLFVLVTLVFAEFSRRGKFLHNRETEHLKANAWLYSLLLVSTTSLLSSLPLVTANYIYYAQNITTPKRFLIYDIIYSQPFKLFC